MSASFLNGLRTALLITAAQDSTLLVHLKNEELLCCPDPSSEIMHSLLHG